jgi:farnesyl-diphosphate farnesyltransferase
LLPPASTDETFLQNAVRFGKGLQLVNILRDVAVDLRRGRCYLPEEPLSAVGLKPADLLDPSSEPRLRPVYNGYLDTALAHLAAGWDYTNAIPSRFVRLRLACAWPILIGVKTLEHLRTAAVLNPQQRVKVSRAEVRALLGSSVFAVALPWRWKQLFESSRLQVSSSK